MKAVFTKLTTFIALAGITIAHLPIQAESTNAIPELVRGNNAFAFQLYGKLKSTEGNLFFSPYSISTCLGMVYAGSRGETEKQMAKTLRFSTNQPSVHRDFGQLQKQLTADSPLKIANALLVQKQLPIEAGFLDSVLQTYQAELKQFDFQTQAQIASDEVNRWVKEKMAGKIKRMLEPGMLNPDTALVLLNTIYFKAAWEKPFETERTMSLPFYLAVEGSVNASMMSQTDYFRYFENDLLKALELPYVGGRFSMVVLLPNRQDGLSALEKIVTAEKISTWISQMTKPEVSVHLPKFKLEQEFELTSTLGEMGMPDAFCGKADFSGITQREQLYISKVIHKSFVEVDEVGTEAAAATSLSMAFGSVEKPLPKIFFASHPFLFAIRDNGTGSILFMGRVTDPTK